MCAMASSTPLTSLTAMSRERNSREKSDSEASTICDGYFSTRSDIIAKYVGSTCNVTFASSKAVKICNFRSFSSCVSNKRDSTALQPAG